MKKSVLLMACLLAMALAGSAQAATMFAVQNSSAQDKMTVSDAGWIGIGTSAPVTPFHVVAAGATVLDAGFTFQYTNTRVMPSVAQAFTAPNFTFTRNNDPSQANGGMPRNGDFLGILNFGTISGALRVNSAVIAAKADGDHSATAWPSTLVFSLQPPATGVLAEVMRITATGMLGVGTATPTSKLQVVGLPVYADNAAALAGGLTSGAFYRTASGVLMVAF